MSELFQYSKNKWQTVEDNLRSDNKRLRAELDALKNALERVVNCYSKQPIYAYGDNEAACDLSDGIDTMRIIARQALANLPQPPKEQ